MTPLRLMIGALGLLVLAALLQLLPVRYVPEPVGIEPVTVESAPVIAPATFTGAAMFRPVRPSNSDVQPAQVSAAPPERPVLIGTLGAQTALVEFENRVQQLEIQDRVGCWQLEAVSAVSARFNCEGQQITQRLYTPTNN